MRELTSIEISQLEEQGCWAEDWQNVMVDDDFMPSVMSNVQLYGHVEIGNQNGVMEVEEGFLRRCCIKNATLRNVTIGDECLIENVRGYISGYAIGDHCLISNVGTITTQEGSTFGQGNTISVLNEGGDGNIVLCEELTSQLAWMMINFPSVRRLTRRHAQTKGSIGAYSRIVGAKDIENVMIGCSCDIHCASHLNNVTILSSEDAATFIGTDVIMENTIVAQGASITDGAKVDNCFVGESVHVGKGFSAEASVFFANSYMDNGEACAALCGPFSTSHHKSTLLIGGAFSFYNAGSGTNQSNHAYKMGPIHWGTLDRGSKTASGSHILWPAHIGPFSMVMGKIQNHPDVHKLPFSYVIAQGEKTYVVPGINIKTVGTWRDVGKWPKRDLRPQSARRDLINFAFPNPYIIQYVMEGKELLLRLEQKQGKDMQEYEYHGCYIKRNALLNGIQYYDMVIRLFLYDYFANSKTDWDEAQGGAWVDLCGMLAPKSEILGVARDIESGKIESLEQLSDILRTINDDYTRSAKNYAMFVVQQLAQNLFIDQDRWMREAEEAHSQWLRLVREDAEKEFQMGDVEEEQLREFIEKVK